VRDSSRSIGTPKGSGIGVAKREPTFCLLVITAKYFSLDRGNIGCPLFLTTRKSRPSSTGRISIQRLFIPSYLDADEFQKSWYKDAARLARGIKNIGKGQ
jgi:hypothetical protein